jgi:two-component system sensor histidine kinase QseC
MSIRNRLLASLFGLWVTVWAAITLVTVERANHEVEELLDAELAQTANVLRSIALAGNLPNVGRRPHTLTPSGHPYEIKISFQLWDGDTLTSAFGGAPDTRLAENFGYSDTDLNGKTWRVFGLPGVDSSQALYVAQDHEIRRELVEYLTLHALQPILWSLPIALMMIWLAVSDGLRTLRRLANEVAERSDRRLAPISEVELPTETVPLVRALNALMEKVRQTLSIERRFAADASHELRTPLAIIRTHTQVAARAGDAKERKQALENALGGVDRAARMITQLLSLSRLNYDSAKRESDSGSLLLAVCDVLDGRRAAAAERFIQVTDRLPTSDICVVAVPTAILDVLIGNLVDNAIKFTPEGGRVSIEVTAVGADALRLTVCDTGPGIPADQREQVFERFCRRADDKQPGAGLGLSIVARICDLHGAKITLSDANNLTSAAHATGSETTGTGVGLRVDILLPRVAKVRRTLGLAR